ncbi:hypothetical protein AALP_AA4G202500 [Arabis alpina]|uniref:Uncharacterized protein n=1 Tax=Arabis alpina TaxID=50452 RepID=A0A087H4H3_ARAAL|nr:hypothetical protein AALP_AA4G202500 [Arabis alpina]
MPPVEAPFLCLWLLRSWFGVWLVAVDFVLEEQATLLLMDSFSLSLSHDAQGVCDRGLLGFIR